MAEGRPVDYTGSSLENVAYQYMIKNQPPMVVDFYSSLVEEGNFQELMSEFNTDIVVNISPKLVVAFKKRAEQRGVTTEEKIKEMLVDKVYEHIVFTMMDASKLAQSGIMPGSKEFEQLFKMVDENLIGPSGIKRHIKAVINANFKIIMETAHRDEENASIPIEVGDLDGGKRRRKNRKSRSKKRRGRKSRKSRK